jgi:hypothetical protein
MDIDYKDLRNYNYRTNRRHYYKTEIKGFYISHEFISLDSSGNLTIHKHYCWDGATWFPDFDCVMEASLVHDAIYQLGREGSFLQDGEDVRFIADGMFRDLCIKNGMANFVAGVLYKFLRKFGGKYFYGE